MTDYNDWPAVFGGNIGERVFIRGNKGRRRLGHFWAHIACPSEDCWSCTQLGKVIEGILNPELDAPETPKTTSQVSPKASPAAATYHGRGADIR